MTVASRLEVRGVSVRFGGVAALQDVSLTAPAGEITGVIGPNGAGKSTLFDVISGLRRPETGSVLVDGRDVTRLGAARRARLGLARTFQRLELFHLLNVSDNVLVAAEIHRRWARDSVDAEAEAQRCLERVGLVDLADQPASELPVGRARLLELARALAVRPRVLLLDEPASGLDERETDQLAGLLRSLTADGMAVVLVEHDLRLVMTHCDRVHVLDRGRMMTSGVPEAVRNDPAVVSAYLGPLTADW